MGGAALPPRRTENGERSARQARDRRSGCPINEAAIQLKRRAPARQNLLQSAKSAFPHSGNASGDAGDAGDAGAPLRGDKRNRRVNGDSRWISQNQSVACEARHAPTGLRAGRAPCAHARPAPCVAYLCDSLWFFMFFVISKTRGSPAGGSRPLIGSNLRNRRFPILAVFVTLCVLCGSRAA